MRKNIVVLFLLGLIVAFSACDKKYEEPKFEIPKYTGPVANRTIADIKAQYDNTGTAHVDSIARKSDPDFIVRAVVVSSDEGGNFYKSLVVQDSTGAIEIEINKTGMYPEYQVGQVVYIKCNGLCVDMYGKKISGEIKGYYRMGWIYQDAVGQINANFVDDYIFKDGLPKVENASVYTIDRNNIYIVEAYVDMADDPMVCRLVEIQNCIFNEASFGKPLSGDIATTEHRIAWIAGTEGIPDIPVSKIIVRTSNYATFRGMKIPETPCTVRGILSKYGDTYQLQLRVKEDFIK